MTDQKRPDGQAIGNSKIPECSCASRGIDHTKGGRQRVCLKGVSEEEKVRYYLWRRQQNREDAKKLRPQRPAATDGRRLRSAKNVAVIVEMIKEANRNRGLPEDAPVSGELRFVTQRDAKHASGEWNSLVWQPTL